jgi:hypothetical protein
MDEEMNVVISAVRQLIPDRFRFDDSDAYPKAVELVWLDFSPL